MLTDQVKIKERWREYFSNLVNVENARKQLGEVPAVAGPVQQISRKEVKKAIESMQNEKARYTVQSCCPPSYTELRPGQCTDDRLKSYMPS